MSFFSAIRDWWGRDKENQIAREAKGVSNEFTYNMSPFPYAGSSQTGYNVLGSSLTIDQDLMRRYADYENMDDYPELSAVLDIYADDSTIPDTIRNRTIWAASKDKVYRDIADDLIYRRLRIEEDIWSVSRSLCKYGNVFAEVVMNETGVVGLNWLPAPTMRRIEDEKGALLGFVQDPRMSFSAGMASIERWINGAITREQAYQDTGLIFFAPWEVVHWRLRSKYLRSTYGYGVLDSSRWVWKRLQMLEDSALVYKLTRSPARYAFYVDTGDLPPRQAIAYVNDVRRQYKKKKLFNQNTGQLEFRYNPLCLSLGTRIPLLNGTTKTLRDLIMDHEAGVQNYAFAMDPATKRVKPGVISWAGVTRRNARVVRVTLDNCRSEVVTPDHPFMLRDGTYKEAQLLEPGDSVMPFYRGINAGGYEYVVHQDHRESGPDKWKSLAPVHRMVAESLFGDLAGRQVHHLDECKRNNYPGNLEVLTPEEHNARHSGEKARRLRVWNKSAAHAEQVEHFNRVYDKGQNIIAYNRSPKHKADNAIRSQKISIKYPAGLLPQLRTLVQQNAALRLTEAVEAIKASPISDEFRSLNANRKRLVFHERHVRAAIHDAGHECWSDFCADATQNHKVASVEWLDEIMDTGSITVDRYNNFAVDSGVFVHNSPDEDFWVPTRGGKESTRIDVISGPDWQCLTGDTAIPLLDGSSRTLAELAETGEDVCLYSLNSAGEVVPGRGRSARKTKLAEVWEVELDNGEVVKCSDNHPFLLRDGKWSRADQLAVGDSLMPLYREVSSTKDGDRLNGYEKVYDPATDGFVYTHQAVHRSRSGSLLPRAGSVIHHSGKGKLDNRPEVLVEMTRSEHSKLHVRLSGHLHSGDVKAAAAESRRTADVRRKLRESWTDERREDLRARNASVDPHVRRRAGERLVMWNRSSVRLDRLAQYNPKRRDVTVEELSSVARESGATGIKDLYQLGYSQNLISRVLRDAGIGWCEFAERYIPGWKPRGRAVAVLNHRVVAIRRTGQSEWLYDLTVDEYHNFAVGQGIFVHNSMDDVEYFRGKLVAATKVPKQYLGLGEGEANRSSLAQEDVQFARTAMRIQRELKNGIKQVGRIHFAVLGIDPDVVRWDYEMTTPSSIFELQQIEVMNARADLAEKLLPSFPREWIMQHVYKLTEGDATMIGIAKAQEKAQDTQNMARSDFEAQQLYPGAETEPDEQTREEARADKRLDTLAESAKNGEQVTRKMHETLTRIERGVAKVQRLSLLRHR